MLLSRSRPDGSKCPYSQLTNGYTFHFVILLNTSTCEPRVSFLIIFQHQSERLPHLCVAPHAPRPLLNPRRPAL